MSEPSMIVRMATTSGAQRRYDHRLRDLVQRTGDVTIATDLGVPRSTVHGWLDAAPRVVVGLEAAALTEPELRQEILKLQRRVDKLAALLRLALALLHASGFSLSRASAGGRRQAADPPRGGSGAGVSPVARGPAVPASVTESVSGLAPTADRMHARRPVVLPSHLTASTETLRGPVDRSHGHLARVSARPDRHARRPRAAAWSRVRVAVDLVPSRAEVQLATPSRPCASSQAEGGATRDRT